MQLYPQLELGLWNGWIPVLLFYGILGLLLLFFPGEIAKKLYDRSLWTKKIRNLVTTGEIVLIAFLVLLVFSPLKYGTLIFFIGLPFFVIGGVGFYAALYTFRNTPEDLLVTEGLYKISRNPQALMLMLMYLGICLMTGTVISLVLLVILIVLLHITTLQEEKQCLEMYGETYVNFMSKVPRYFLLF